MSVANVVVTENVLEVLRLDGLLFDTRIFLPFSRTEDVLKILSVPSSNVLTHAMIGCGSPSAEHVRVKLMGLSIFNIAVGEIVTTGGTETENTVYEEQINIKYNYSNYH